MKRQMLLPFALVLLAGMAIGAIVSISTIDMDRHNFQLQYTGTVITEDYIEAQFEISTYRKLSRTDANSLIDEFSVVIPLSKYDDCRNLGNTKNQCVAELTSRIELNAGNTLFSRYTILKDQFETEYRDELVPGDFVIDTGVSNDTFNQKRTSRTVAQQLG